MSEPDVDEHYSRDDETRTALGAYLEWIAEIIAAVASLVAWLVTGQLDYLVYTLGTVASLWLIFRLANYSRRRSSRQARS